MNDKYEDFYKMTSVPGPGDFEMILSVPGLNHKIRPQGEKTTNWAGRNYRREMLSILNEIEHRK